MKKREVICALIAGTAILDVIGVVGSVDVGCMELGECIPRALIAMFVAVVAVVIGESSPAEKKEAAPDGNQDSGSTQ